MALYLGSSEKLKISLNNVVYCLNLYSALLDIEDILLGSSDDCFLTDLNGLYLTTKEDE